MTFSQAPVSSLDVNPFKSLEGQGFLVTAGNSDKFNTMTAGWGGFGVMWSKRVMTVVVRPSRYTYEFMESSDIFTSSFFTSEYADALKFCGTRSGRKFDKCKETGLTPVFADGGVAFEQAEFFYVCKKLYAYDIVPEGFVSGNVSDFYPHGDLHRAYVGEIISAYKK